MRSNTRRSGNVLAVDTYLDFHVAVLFGHLGRRLGGLKVPTIAGCYRRLLSWCQVPCDSGSRVAPSGISLMSLGWRSFWRGLAGMMIEFAGQDEPR